MGRQKTSRHGESSRNEAHRKAGLGCFGTMKLEIASDTAWPRRFPRLGMVCHFCFSKVHLKIHENSHGTEMVLPQRGMPSCRCLEGPRSNSQAAWLLRMMLSVRAHLPACWWHGGQIETSKIQTENLIPITQTILNRCCFDFFLLTSCQTFEQFGICRVNL